MLYKLTSLCLDNRLQFCRPHYLCLKFFYSLIQVFQSAEVTKCYKACRKCDKFAGLAVQLALPANNHCAFFSSVCYVTPSSTYFKAFVINTYSSCPLQTGDNYYNFKTLNMFFTSKRVIYTVVNQFNLHCWHSVRIALSSKPC